MMRAHHPISRVMGGKSEEAHHAVLLPALLLQHDDAVRALVEGGGQALPLRVQRLDPPFQVELALSHYCDLVPDDGTIIISGKAKRFNFHLRVSRWVTCSVMLVFLWFTWMMMMMMTMMRMVMVMLNSDDNDYFGVLS